MVYDKLDACSVITGTMTRFQRDMQANIYTHKKYTNTLAIVFNCAIHMRLDADTALWEIFMGSNFFFFCKNASRGSRTNFHSSYSCDKVLHSTAPNGLLKLSVVFIFAVVGSSTKTAKVCTM